MTKFIDATKEVEKEQEKKETVFNYFLNENLEIEKAIETQPKAYKVVMFLFNDKDYGDVFRCYDDNKNISTLCFGIKGDEFK